MAINKILYNGKTFTSAKEILSGNCIFASSLSNDELSIDKLSATIDGSSRIATRFVPRGSSGLLTSDKKLFMVMPYVKILTTDLSDYLYGAPVYYYRDDVLIGKFYMVSSKRSSRYTFEISCASAIDLLDNSTHYGGIYNGTPMKDLLADIIGGIVPYSLDPIFQNIPVFGWLPVATRRENLQQLMLAEGSIIKKDASGDLAFTYLKSSESVGDIGDDRTFPGTTVDYGRPVTSVKVLEHSYVAYSNQEAKSLYEDYVPNNTITTPKGNTVNGALVQFDSPMFDLTVESGTIVEQGANYAVLQGGGYCKLFGKPYAHTTRENIVSKPATRGLVSVADNIATIDNATLVSLLNGENVAKRALAYYGYAKTTSADIVVQNERPADLLSYKDPYGDTNSGFMQSMSFNMSGLWRANTKLVSGFIPPSPGNYFNNVVVVSEGGTYTVPEGVTKLRVVLISGGTGGYSGEKGEDGGIGYPFSESGQVSQQSWSGYSFGKGGEGGKPGLGGSGGKVYEIEIDVTPGQAFDVTLGSGGAGGVCTGASGVGNPGGATRFGTYSSDSGSSSDYGYVELFSGKVYAAPGPASGVQGGTGSGADDGEGFTIVPGSTIVNPSGGTWVPGANGNFQVSHSGSATATSREGAGGGPAFGANGLNGGTGRASAWASFTVIVGGAGGYGAKPIAQIAQSALGGGGAGGHGGGGGGGGGAVETLHPSNISVSTDHTPGPGGTGGLGGDGGQGGPGCVIIYY